MWVFFDIYLHRPILQMMEWDNKYSVGISMIDEEHKKLIGILNKAIFAKKHNDNPEEIKEVLSEMAKYSQKYFSTEEANMIKFNFPEYQSHRNEHLDFTDKTIASYNKLVMGDYQIANELLEYLKQWLVNHILVTDRQYIDCFKKNGLK